MIFVLSSFIIGVFTLILLLPNYNNSNESLNKTCWYRALRNYHDWISYPWRGADHKNGRLIQTFNSL